MFINTKYIHVIRLNACGYYSFIKQTPVTHIENDEKNCNNNEKTAHKKLKYDYK